MDGPNRRGFLAAAGAIALAGCADASIPFVSEESEEDDGPREYLLQVRETVTVEKESYELWEFESDETTTIAMEMESDSEYDVDFYLMPQDQLEPFENGETFDVSQYNSHENTNYMNQQNRYDPNEFAIVADNTSAGVAEPPVDNTSLGPAEIEVDIEAWV